MHVPAWQVSVWVQALPSSHVLPVDRPQVPSLAAPAATLHAWQSLVTPPPQAVSQHTPSTQKPLPHCVPLVHDCPSLRAWQVPLLHTLLAHWPSLAQVAPLLSPHTPVAQVPLPHSLPVLHVWPLASAQVPEPLQAIVPSQLLVVCNPAITCPQVPSARPVLLMAQD